MIRGLVIGKFYPPHRGHKFLIETALAQVDHLDVLICARSDQTISGELRAQWLREIHPRAFVRAIDDPGRDDDSEFWASYTKRLLGRAPDVVFTSEDYGEAYARFLGCRHVMVDRERSHVPVSGRAIRSAPLDHWEYLEPCVRAYFARRVCVVGAESTGTTTLAQDLARRYSTAWVPEFGREYCERLQAANIDLWTYQWRTEEFTEIARRQQEMENRLAREANRILICDTDVLATSIWHERYIGNRSPEVEAIIHESRHDLYLLTDCDIPFVQDGLRDGETIRQWMTRRFEEVLDEKRLFWVKVSGSREQRLKRSTVEVDKLLLSHSINKFTGSTPAL
ncbi:MAG TPA: AAA family ATPase [Candidatus Sulfotelmatobacter sp.]|nr:AAA family ATPase [Candidatus Sulfotelmatobacter sp.]